MNAVTKVDHVPPRIASPTRAERLRVLARAVERPGASGRRAPENVLLVKLTVAPEMRRPAREPDATGGMR